MTGPPAPPTPASPDRPAIEDRLRRGLREAAADLPTDGLPYGFVVAPGGGDDVSDGPDGSPGRVVRRAGIGPWRRLAPGLDRRAVAVAAAAALVAGALGFTARWATEPSPAGVEAGEADAAPGDGAVGRVGDGLTSDPSGDNTYLSPAEGVTGRAQVVGRQLLTFNTDGETIGGRSLAPLEQVVAIASDTQGGWVACGPGRPAPIWYPRSAVPVELDRRVACGPDALSVVRTVDGPVLVHREAAGGGGERLAARALDVDRPTEGDVDLGIVGISTEGWGAWAASWNAVVAETPEGLRMFTLDGEEQPVGVEFAGDIATLRMAMDVVPSGSSTVQAVAAVVAPPGATDGRATSELVVWDATSGDVLRSEPLAAAADDVSLSFDGEWVAFAVPGTDAIRVELDTGERMTFGLPGRSGGLLLP